MSNMKKIFLIIIAAVMGCVAVKAAQLSQAQTKAKIEIYNALKKSCTNITDEDESLRFQYNGTQYFVNIHSLNPQVLYLSLVLGFNLPDSYNPDIANIAALQAASAKPVCAAAYNGALVFSCEMYTKEVKSFIAVFPEMLQALSSSAEGFQEAYDEAEKNYVSTSLTSSVVNLNDNEFIYPKVSSTHTDETKLYVAKVTLDPNYTILDMVSYNGGQIMNCTMNRHAYIMANGKKYDLIKAEGITYNPTFTDYPNWESGREVSLSFKLYFPPLPKSTTTFDFMESPTDGWQVKGVDLKHGNAYTINGERIETAYHKWDCTGIEVQDGQTIVTKTVQPKSEGTFMYSSQDEYIEDAETGRKYYLLNSSIGFEGSPEISHDTKTITFYEVYPALPSSVKKINISSGSQYYVKDLKIR